MGNGPRRPRLGANQACSRESHDVRPPEGSLPSRPETLSLSSRPAVGLLCVVGLLSSALGCAWVDLTEEGRTVTLAQVEQVEGCEKLGTTRTKVLHRVLFIDRSATKVASELANLARNEAASLGGDTIVAIDRIDRGTQRFDVYRCGG